MPSYPKAGSIRMVDGIAVVKFGPLLEEQKKYYGVPVQTWGVSGRGEIPAGAALLWKNSDKNIWFNPQIKVRRSGEKTLLKIKGNNPFFVLHRLPGRDALISIEFTSNWKDTMEIFFKRRDPAGKQLPGFKVEKNFQFGFNRIVFYVPREVMAANRTLRIDPGRGKAGKIELRKITVYAAETPKNE